MSLYPQLMGRVLRADEAVKVFPDYLYKRDFSFTSYRTEAQASRGAA